MPALYGLTGYPLEHSFSPAYFRKKFAEGGIDADYQLFPVTDAAELPALLRHKNLCGLNVTIPYKESITTCLDQVDSAASDVGAVNCVTIRQGVTCGYNTDVIGFEQSLQPLLQSHHTHALILGSGGSSKAVAWVLGKLGINYKVVSRSKSQRGLTYTDLNPAIIEQHQLIVNTTPVGMYPGIDAAPVLSYRHIGSKHLLYDLIYNPEETRFLALGKSRGATVKNGMEMLALQAEASWKLWQGGR